jgi:DnaK suppressor protein
MAATATKSDKKNMAAKSPKIASNPGKVSGSKTKSDAKAAPNITGTEDAVAVPKRSATRSAINKQGAATASALSTRGLAASINAPQSRSSLSNNKTADGIADKIHRSAVSKVTEVATKSPKTPAEKNAGDTLLSEAQLLKMNDKDYMNEAQLAFFKARLQQLEKDLLKNAGETTEHLRETVLVPDPADRATIEEEHALELRTRDRERKLLKKVQQSIASIDGGEYGWCEETGEPIGIPRLLARPTATLSLEAQQRRELKQKLYGD